MLGPESQNLRPLNSCFGNHISEAYHALPSTDKAFSSSKLIENSHLLWVLRSAICMWPYATLGSEAGNKPEGENGQRENELPEEKDQEKHQYQTVTLEKSPETEHFLREKGEEELRAVQRRDGHEVKDRQNEVDEDDDGRNLDESRAGPPGRGPKAKQKPENQSERDVGKRAGPGHYRLRPVAGAQIVGIVRHGLGPADDKAAQKI